MVVYINQGDGFPPKVEAQLPRGTIRLILTNHAIQRMDERDLFRLSPLLDLTDAVFLKVQMLSRSKGLDSILLSVGGIQYCIKPAEQGGNAYVLITTFSDKNRVITYRRKRNKPDGRTPPRVYRRLRQQLKQTDV